MSRKRGRETKLKRTVLGHRDYCTSQEKKGGTETEKRKGIQKDITQE